MPKLGENWDVEVTETNVTQDIDFSKFSTLVFDKQPWNVSHALSEDDMRENAQVILKLKGFPVIASSSEGSVIWSGLNLPYHVIRDHNMYEATLLQNILEELTHLDQSRPASYTLEWKSPQERVIKTDGARGVLLKEQAFPGWVAYRVENGRKTEVPIHITGPSTPGFMYVFADREGPSTVVFRYKGDKSTKILTFLSLITIIFLIDAILFQQKTITALLKFSWKKIRHPLHRWWEKDEFENY